MTIVWFCWKRLDFIQQIKTQSLCYSDEGRISTLPFRFFISLRYILNDKTEGNKENQ